MKKNLFGTLGQYIKGNWVIVVLAVATIAAGALSFNTIKDINNKLKNQQIPVPDTVSEEQQQTESEEAQDVQQPAENVPLKPKTTPKPAQTPKADSDAAQETTTPAEGVEKADPDQPADKFVLPLDGKIFNSFSGNELVYNTTMGDWRTHNGIDIKATRDTAVKASCDGVVKKVYEDGMLGWVVEIATDDFATRYCGLGKNVFVREGDRVKQGQSIGAVGEIPLEITEDSHIHLEVVKNGEYQNPKDYLEK